MKKLTLVLLILCLCFPLASCGNDDEKSKSTAPNSEYTYVINKSSKVFHYTDCYSAKLIKDSNRKYTDTRPSTAYKPCGNCNP